MNPITAIVEPDADGYVHLQVPVEMRGSRVKVIAEAEQTREAVPAACAKLEMGEFGHLVLVAPPGAPPMTPERIKAILEGEE